MSAWYFKVINAIIKVHTSFCFSGFLNHSVVQKDWTMNLVFIVVVNILALGYATPDQEAGLKVEDLAIRKWRKGDHNEGV